MRADRSGDVDAFAIDWERDVLDDGGSRLLERLRAAPDWVHAQPNSAVDAAYLVLQATRWRARETSPLVIHDGRVLTLAIEPYATPPQVSVLLAMMPSSAAAEGWETWRPCPTGEWEQPSFDAGADTIYLGQMLLHAPFRAAEQATTQTDLRRWTPVDVRTSLENALVQFNELTGSWICCSP